MTGLEARPGDVIDETLELMMDLDATDEQLDCPLSTHLPGADSQNTRLGSEEADMSPLFETIINHIPAPEGRSGRR